MSDEWRDLAACKDMPPDVFFPEKGQPAARAKAVCARCPVRSECLEYALNHEMKHGVWGGYSERELRVMRGRHRYRLTCKECAGNFVWVKNRNGGTLPIYCSRKCASRAKGARENVYGRAGRPASWSGADPMHSPPDGLDPRDRAAFAAVYDFGDWNDLR